MKLKLDLHDIYNRGGDIDRALRSIIDEAVAKKAPLVEIIPGKGTGQLRSGYCGSWSKRRSRRCTGLRHSGALSGFRVAVSS